MEEKILKSTHDGTLTLSKIEIPCFVLENGTRLISQRGFQKSVGMSIGGGSKAGVRRLDEFLSKLGGTDIEMNELTARINNPIIFQPFHGGRTAYGYEATILADFCDTLIDARNKYNLTGYRKKIADRCEALMRAFAKVGIIALVDAATGYEEIRDRLALQKILEQYLLEEYQKIWAKRFPDEFYIEMFRLKSWQWKGMQVNRPSVVGTYTNDIVYKRLAPGVLEEIKERNKRLEEEGDVKVHQHRWLTLDTGIPALDRHLHAVIALMRAAPNWGSFHRSVKRAFPVKGDQIPMDIPEKGD